MLAVGDDVDGVAAIGAGRQLDDSRAGVALARTQRRAVAVHDRANLRGALGDEGRVGADPDVVQPASGAGPDGGACVLHRPGDGGVLAREVARQGGDVGDAQVGRRVGDVGHGTVDVVVLGHFGHVVAAKVAVAGVGLHHQVAAADRGAQVHGLADRVALVVAERTLLLELADQPVDAGLGRIGVVHQPDLVGPGAIERIAPVLDAVAEAVAAGGGSSGGRGDRADDQVGRGDAQHADRAGLVVVVVDLGGIVGVEVVGQRVFEDRVVGVAPDGHEVLAGLDAIGQLGGERAEVVLAHGEVAGVGCLADLDVALAGVGAGFVHGKPDGVGPAIDRGRVAARDGGALVADLVAHLDAGAVHGLVGGDHVAGDEVGKRDGLDAKTLGAGVVAFAGVLVDAVGAVGHHDQVSVAPVADRDVDLAEVGGVGVAAGRERRAAVDAGKQHVVAAQDAVERKIDVVLPLAAGGLGPGVGHGEADAGAGAGGDRGWHDDVGDAQVGPVVERHDDGVGVGRGVVVARSAVLVDLRAATGAEQAVGDDAQAVGAFDLAGQANLLGAGVADAGFQPPVVAEVAQHHGRAVGGEQQHGVLPLAGGAGQAQVEHGPAHVHERALLRAGGCVEALDDQVGRVAERDRHGHRVADVVVGVDELVGAAGGDVEEPVARDAIGQAHIDAAVVGVTHRHLAQVPGVAEVEALAAAVGVLAQPDAVVPAAGVGDADAAVGHGPLHGDVAAAVGGARGADRLHAHVGVGDGHHVGSVGRGLLVVGLAGVLPDQAGGVGLDDDRAVTAEGRAEAVVEAGAVARTRGQGAVVHHLAQHDVVAVADDVVGAVDDAVGPTAGAAGTRALVGDGPLHRDAGGVVDDAGGCGHADHGQIGVGVLGHADAQRVEVVGFEGGLVVGVGRVGDHDQAPGTGEVHRQLEVERAVAAGTSGQGVDQALAKQGVGAVDGAVLGQVDLLADGGGVGAADVAGLPVQGDGLAALEQAGRRQRAHHEVGCHDADRLAADVVGLVGLGDVVAPVGHDLQAPTARWDGRHGQRQALRERAACGQAAEGPGGAEHLRGRQAQGVHQADFFTKEAADRVVAAVAHGVVELHGLAHAPVGGRRDAFDLQIGLGLGAHRGGVGGDHDVVGGAAKFIDSCEGVGLDDEVTRPGGVARDGEIQPGGVTLAHRERAHAGDRADERGLRGQARGAAEVDLIDPAVDVGGDRAAIADGPLHPRRAAGKNFRRHEAERGDQVGVGLGDRERVGDAQVVGPGVGFAHVGVGIGDHRDAVVALDAAGDADRELRAVAVAHRQCGVARHGAEQHIVGIADDGVAAQHDAVDPGRGGAGGAAIADRPAHAGGVAREGRCGHDQGGDRQIGVQAQAGVEIAGPGVVGFGVAGGIGFEQHTCAAGGTVRADADDEAAGAQGAIRQVELQAAYSRLTRCERQGSGSGEGHQSVEDDGARAAVGIALAHDDAVLVGHGRRHEALIDVFPQQGESVTGLQARGLLQAHIAHQKIGADLQGLLHAVVVLERAAGAVLGNLRERVDHHAQLVAANRIEAGRPVERGLASDRRPGGQRLCGERLADAGDHDAGGLVDQLHALGPGA